MRLLHFADLHLDTPFTWAPTEVARARRQALRDTLQRICELAADLEVDALTCGGDLYEHEKFTPDTVEFLRATFAAIDPIPVYVAPGNHDWIGPTSIYRQAQWSPNVHVFDDSVLTPVTLTDGFTLWGAGHRGPANTPNLLDGFVSDRSGVNVALFHGSALGGLALQDPDKQPHAPFRAEQIRHAGLDHALLGHFHAPVKADDHTYPGNPDPLSFGETGIRGAVLVTVADDGAVTREWQVVARSQVTAIEVDLTGVTHNAEALERAGNALTGKAGLVRLDLHGEVAPTVDLQESDFQGLRPSTVEVLIPRLRLRFGYDLTTIKEELTVRGQFVRSVIDAPGLSEEDRDRIIVTGLRALDGRRDLGVI